MSDMRGLIDKAVAGVQAAPDALDRTMRRVDSRRLNRRVGAGAAALVLTGVATWSVWSSFVGAPGVVSTPSPGGEIVFVTQDRDDRSPLIAVMDSVGSDITVLGSGSQPAWSPDGDRIAYMASTADGGTGIFVMNADGTQNRQLTENASGADESPSWSPDGTQLVFSRVTFITGAADPVSTRARRDVFVVDLDDGDVSRLIGGPSDDFEPAWSPDGSQIAFTRILDPEAQGANSEPQVWSALDDGLGQIQLTTLPDGAFAPEWSPDGDMIVADSAGEGFWVIHSATGDVQTVELTAEVNDALNPTWGQDGQSLVFAAYQGNQTDLFTFDLRSGRVERLTESQSQDVSPDTTN